MASNGNFPFRSGEDANRSVLIHKIDPIEEPPPTHRLWADMFGLGQFFKVLSDPSLVTQVHSMMGAVIEAAAANRRIEDKLDRLLSERDNAPTRPSALPPQHRSDGSGGHPSTSGLADDGDSAIAFHHRDDT